tara:strand:+ start:4581 stop:5177 length:597 start_codon:yes stop_codon:yes gene_type:complete
MKLEYNTGRKERKMVPEGSHVARLYGIVDLGTQDTFYGPKKQVAMMYELPDETHVFREEDGPQPMGRHRIDPASLNEKSNLLKQLKALNGKAFTAKELAAGITLEDQLGKPCLVSVVHRKGKDGQMYDNIDSVTALPKGMEAKELTNEPYNYDICESNAGWDRVPEWMKNKIKESPEYISTFGGQDEAIESEATSAPF